MAASGLLSPAASVASASTSTTHTASPSTALPTPRHTPLKPGSNKETSLINFMDRSIRALQRKGVIPSGPVLEEHRADFVQQDHNSLGEQPSAGDTGVGERYGEGGYSSYRQLARDLEKLIDVLWVSGTPALQVPYYLNLALLAITYIPSYPVAPRTMFRILGKLDAAFAGLLSGVDIDKGDLLPGFEGGRKAMSGTDKVRLKSLVDKTRVLVVRAMQGEFDPALNKDRRDDEDEDDDDDDANPTDDADMANDNDDNINGEEEQIGAVYEKTLMLLGNMGDDFPIGVNFNRGPQTISDLHTIPQNANDEQLTDIDDSDNDHEEMDD